MPDWIVTKSSPRSVPDTVQRTVRAGRGQGAEAVRRDRPQRRGRGARTRAARHEGGRVRQPGRGDAGDAGRPLAALDLPLKVLVWDEDGQTRVSYTAPSELAARYGLSDELAARLAGIDGLTDALVSG